MARLVIGVDPHKRSATIEVLDERERVQARLGHRRAPDAQVLIEGGSRTTWEHLTRCAELTMRPGVHVTSAHGRYADGWEVTEATGDPEAVQSVRWWAATSSLRGEAIVARGFRRLLQPSSEGAS